MTTDWKELMIYIAKNVQLTSKFLTPIQTANIEVIGLLNKIAELRNISNEENGIEFNNICDKIQKIN